MEQMLNTKCVIKPTIFNLNKFYTYNEPLDTQIACLCSLL